MTPTRGRLISVRLAAIRLGVGAAALRNAIGRNEVTVQRYPSGRLAGIFEADADAWIAGRTQRAAAPAVKPAPQSVDERMEQLMPPKHERLFAH